MKRILISVALVLSTIFAFSIIGETNVNASEMRNLYKEITNDIKSDAGVNFGIPAIDTNGGQGMFKNSKSTDTIYYFRGDNTLKNNVIYAGKCWQIVRTTPEGAMKLIYNGTPSANETCENTGLKSNIYYNEAEDTAVSVAYNDEENNGDYLTSNAKTIVDQWFEENLMDYKDELADVMYCNDTDWQREHARLSEHRDPTFACQESHQLTVANQRLKYPIAMIDADELMFSGATYNGDPVSPTGYYIDTGKFHSITQESDNKMFYNNSKHYINRTGGTNYPCYLRAVIAVPNATTFINTGDGSRADPFRITHQELPDPEEDEEDTDTPEESERIIPPQNNSTSDPVNNPNTVDDIMIYVALLIGALCILVILFIIHIKKKKNRNNHQSRKNNN